MGRLIPQAERQTKGDHRYTDHSTDIAALRGISERIVAAFPDVNTAPSETRKDAVIAECAAALLEVHDDTGIALDNWTGPYELVIEGLALIGQPREAFIPNGV